MGSVSYELGGRRFEREGSRDDRLGSGKSACVIKSEVRSRIVWIVGEVVGLDLLFRGEQHEMRKFCE